MALWMNFPGKNFNPGDPNFLQLRFAATCSQFSGIDARCGYSLSNTAAFVIPWRKPFSCALIQADPQIFLVHRCLAEPLICLTKLRANRYIIFIAAARRQIYAGRLRRAPWPRSMLEYFVYLIYRAGFALISLLPLRVSFAVGNGLGFCAWLVLGKYRRLGFRNIEIAFGREKSPQEMRHLVRRHFQRLGANLLSGLKLASMPLEKARANVRIENADAAHRELRSGRPIVFILSHIGNWELQAQMFPAAVGYVRNSTIHQPLQHRYLDKHLRKLRGRAGVELFDRNEGFQKAIELLRGGGAIGILSDEHTGDQGLWAPFFGKLASTTSLPALLAKRTGAAVIGIAVYTEAPGRWRLQFDNAIDKPGDSVEAIT